MNKLTLSSCTITFEEGWNIIIKEVNDIAGEWHLVGLKIINMNTDFKVSITEEDAIRIQHINLTIAKIERCVKQSAIFNMPLLTNNAGNILLSQLAYDGFFECKPECFEERLLKISEDNKIVYLKDAIKRYFEIFTPCETCEHYDYVKCKCKENITNKDETCKKWIKGWRGTI